MSRSVAPNSVAPSSTAPGPVDSNVDRDDRPPLSARAFWLGVSGLTLVGFVLRVVTAGFTNRPTGNGALHFLPEVVAFARGDLTSGFEIAVPPGPSFLASLFWPLVGSLFGSSPGGNSELAFQCATVVLGTLLVPLTALLARPWGRRVALLAAFFMALSSRGVIYSAITEAEGIYGFFVTLGLVLALAWHRTFRGGNFALALPVAGITGLALGAAIQCRPEGIALPGLVAAFVLVSKRTSAWGDHLAPKLGSIALLLGAALLVCLPYSLFLKEQTGEWHFSGKLNAHLLEGDEPYQLTEDARFTLWEYTLREEPFEAASPLEWSAGSSILKRWARGVYRYVSITPRYTEWLPSLGIVLLLVTLVWRRRRYPVAEPMALAVLGGVVTFYYLALPVVLTSWRLFIPYLPILFVLASLGFVRALSTFVPTVPPRGKRAIFAVVTVAFAALALGSLERRHLRDYGWAWRTSPERRLGELLESRIEPGAPLIEYINGTVYHYAAALHLIYPAATPDAFARHCRLRNVEYVVLDTERLDPKRYPWQAGVEPTSSGDVEPDDSILAELGFERVATEVESGTRRQLLLYRRTD